MFRIGCVSYLNAKPLIFGLDSDPSIDLRLEVPARLLDGLLQNRFDVALLPVIDYQRMENLILVPAGGIGSEDQTLTVRIFSKVPIGEIRTLCCDAESHTSVALARIILGEAFGNQPEFVRSKDADALLLIGDKVICRAPHGYPYELDLGSAWRKLTGLPFLFACWTARKDVDLGELPEKLVQARRRGMKNISEIVQHEAVPRGWPVEIAFRYLTEHLCYEVGPRQLEAVRRFHESAARYGLIESFAPLKVASISNDE